MLYTWWELICYLLLYGFLGWLTEVLLLLAGGKRLTNRGFFNLPICPEYGTMAVVLLVVLSSFGEELSLRSILLQSLLTLAVVVMVDFVSGFLVARIWHRHIRRFETSNLLGGRLQGAGITLLQAALLLVVLKLVHPFVYVLLHLIPPLVCRVAAGGLVLLLLADFAVTCCSAHRCRSLEELQTLQDRRSSSKSQVQGGLIGKMTSLVWRRMKRAYPEMAELQELRRGQQVFAPGICAEKLLWIFVLCALAGDLIETVYCRFTAGYWMSRTSVIYGTLSIVWGFGGVLMTIIMSHMRHREDRYVFLTGMFLGGAYEYSCSVISEYVFGTTFWDYSEMAFNIGGRTNLLFCLFWGIIAVVWVKLCFPALNALIERFHPVYGKLLTWGIVVLLAADLALSGAVLLRYVQRTEGLAPANGLEMFIDRTYSDSFIETIWPNMRITN